MALHAPVTAVRPSRARGVLVAALCLVGGVGTGAAAYYVFPSEQRRAYLEIARAATPDAVEEFVRLHPNSRWRPEMDGLLWQAVGSGERVADLESYVGIFPEGAHRAAADERIAFLRVRAAPRLATIQAFLRDFPSTPWRGDVDEIFWRLVARADDPGVPGRAYLAALPEGRHAAAAGEFVGFAALRRGPTVEGAATFLADHPETTYRSVVDTMFWEAAAKAKDDDGVRKYLAVLPQGDHAEKARARLALSALRASPSIDAALAFLAGHPDRPAEAEGEGILWALVDRSGLEEDYARYLAALPSGPHAQEARTSIPLARLEARPSVEAAVAYLRERPESPHVGRVQELLFALARKSGRVEDFVAYLGVARDGAHAAEAREIVDFDALAAKPTLSAVVAFRRAHPTSGRVGAVRSLELSLLEAGGAKHADAPPPAILRTLLASAGASGKVLCSISGFPSQESLAVVRKQLDGALVRFGVSLADASVGASLRILCTHTLDLEMVYGRGSAHPETISVRIEIVPKGATKAAWATTLSAKSPESVSYHSPTRTPWTGAAQSDVHAATLQVLVKALAELFVYPEK